MTLKYVIEQVHSKELPKGTDQGEPFFVESLFSARTLNTLTPLLTKASFNNCTTFFPTAPVAVKSFVQRIRSPDVRLFSICVCCT